MSVQVEKLEKSSAKLTITVPAAEFDKAMKQAYNKNKNSFNIPGFRKGKVPMNMVIKMYGEAVLYNDAVDFVLPLAYEQAVKEAGVTPMSRPDIDITEIGMGKDMVFTAVVATKPEVTLGEYKGLSVEKADLTVTEEEVAAKIAAEQKKNAVEVPVEGRAAENNDIAVIDFEGFVDGVAFEGGKGEDHPLTLGSGAFIPGFEEQIVGKNAGEEFDVNVTFPADYNAAELAGKDATFKVALKELKTKELPEIDDEFAAEVSEFDTLEEYKKDVEAKLVEEKATQAKAQKEDKVIELAVTNASMEINERQIQAEAEEMYEQQAQQMKQYGLNMEMYLQYTGTTQEQFVEQCKAQAEKRIQTRLVLEAIAAAEGIEASDDEVNAKINEMAEQYSMQAEDVKKALGDLAPMKADIACQKALDLITDAAVEA